MINGLPERLKALRLKYNLSQKEVANRLHVSASIISGYETGERTPSTENILALSYLYHCTTDYLLGSKKQMQDSALDTLIQIDEACNGWDAQALCEAWGSKWSLHLKYKVKSAIKDLHREIDRGLSSLRLIVPNG